MSLINKKYVLKFQKIYKEEFSEEISFEEASSECMDMFILGKILLKPVIEKDVKELEKKYPT